MGKYIISGESLERIADAIREKTGGTEPLTPGQMAEEIAGLSIGSAGAEPYAEYTMDADGNVVAARLVGFTRIPDRMFFENANLQMVDFSGSPGLTEIGNYAFGGCTNLALAALPEGLTSIGGSVFNGCTNLALTALPEGLTSIGNYAFQNCTNLALTALPEGLTSISNYAFQNCTNLKNMEIKAARLGTGIKIFQNCTGLEMVWIRSSCDTITAASAANAPFAGCSTTLKIYAEDASKQSGWGTYFNRTGSSGGTTVSVVYGQTECPW